MGAARRTESAALRRLIDGADESLSLLASLDGFAGGSQRLSLSQNSNSSIASGVDGAFAFGSSASSTPFLAGGSGDERASLPSINSSGRNSAVESSVRAGLLHVRGVFPDHSVEFVDVDPRFATVGELKRALCAKRAPQRDLGFDAAGARLMVDGQLADDDWTVLDCALGADATLHVVRAFGGGGFLGGSFGFSSVGSGNTKLPISSIASVYTHQQSPPLALSQFDASSESGSSGGGFPSALTLSLAATAAHTTNNQQNQSQTLARPHARRPEEATFAEMAADFYEHLAGVQNTDVYCEKLLGGYIDALQTRLESLEAAARANPRLQEDLSELRDERNTWRLLYELRQICHDDGSGDGAGGDEGSDDDALMVGTEGVELHFDMVEDDAVRLLETRSESYRIQRAVKAWLESMALEQAVVGSDKRGNSSAGSRTLRFLKKGLLQCDDGARAMVHLDPDAALREGDEHIVEDDAEDEAELLKSVWHLVRAGKLSDAVDLCIRAGQAWRAASLSGGAPLGASESSERRDEAALERWGNPYRVLWKATCWQFSEPKPQLRLTKGSSVLARQYEEIVYAALSGNVAAIARSPLCASWEDHVWAFLCAMTEQQQDELLHRLLQVKLQSSQLVAGSNALYLRHYAAMLEKTKYLKRYAADLDALFEELKGSRVESVRAQANEPHRHIQAKLVTAKVEYIVSSILDALLFSPEDDAYHWDLLLHATLQADALSPRLLRFAAHFVLFASFTGETFDEQAGHMIVKAYIRHLVKHRELQLVPVYASRLPYAGAVEIYVQVLAAVDDRLERELLVKRIRQFASMDVLSTVLQIAVDRMCEEYRHAAREQTQLHNGMAATPSLLDVKRMRTIEYLCFYAEHRAEALHRANILARQFVHEGKFSLLAPLFTEHVPEDSLGVVDAHRGAQTRDDADVARSVREVLCWKAYMSACSQYDAWRDCVSVSGTHAAFSLYSEEKEFLTDLMYHVARAANALLEALHFESGWMLRCLDSEEDEAAIRQLCLPLLVFNLHYLQLESARVVLRLQFYPAGARVEQARPLLEKALQVADVVADEHYGVYRALSQTECRDLLHGFRETSLALLFTESLEKETQS